MTPLPHSAFCTPAHNFFGPACSQSIDELETDIDNVSQQLQAAALNTQPKVKTPKRKFPTSMTNKSTIEM